jgi:hypothetical protein
MLDFGCDPKVNCSGNSGRYSSPIVPRPVADNDHAVASTTQSCKAGSCPRNELDLTGDLSITVSVANDYPIAIHYYAGLWRERHRIKGQDVPYHRHAYFDSFPNASTGAFGLSDAALKAYWYLNHRNTMSEGHQKHVGREVISADGEIRQYPFKCAASDCPEGAPNVRQTCRSEV